MTWVHGQAQPEKAAAAVADAAPAAVKAATAPSWNMDFQARAVIADAAKAAAAAAAVVVAHQSDLEHQRTSKTKVTCLPRLACLREARDASEAAIWFCNKVSDELNLPKRQRRRASAGLRRVDAAMAN